MFAVVTIEPDVERKILTKHVSKGIIKKNFYIDLQQKKKINSRILKSSEIEKFNRTENDKFDMIRKNIPKSEFMKQRFSLRNDMNLTTEKVKKSCNFILMNDTISMKKQEISLDIHRVGVKKWTFPKNAFIKKRNEEIKNVSGLKIEAISYSYEENLRPATAVKRSESVKKKSISNVSKSPPKIKTRKPSLASPGLLMTQRVQSPTKPQYNIEYRRNHTTDLSGQDICGWDLDYSDLI
ncbi:unnamed protein product [Blepharisma stoltei]|uniref:Uncharacterized protein n=1 Tax=Blepharisma stoltei TaxID=1481888 RepID=A0AAU9IGC0_9CILI|nr:unnamed protein product [Blepharisma stoltei]